MEPDPLKFFFRNLKQTSINFHDRPFTQEEKYILKSHIIPGLTNDDKITLHPTLKICQCEVSLRMNAANKNSFFLVETKKQQMVEFMAPSSTDCKK